MNTPRDKIRNAWAVAYYEAQSIRVSRWLYKVAQSPIEKILGEALSIIHTQALESFVDGTPLVRLEGLDNHDDFIFKITPQAKIGNYTADFLVECRLCRDKKLVVECDGHDFHEKTKAQAAHDKKRDRVMTVKGYGVLRFTGSEVFKDPCACLVDVVEYFYQFVTLDELHEAAEALWSK